MGIQVHVSTAAVFSTDDDCGADHTYRIGTDPVFSTVLFCTEWERSALAQSSRHQLLCLL